MKDYTRVSDDVADAYEDGYERGSRLKTYETIVRMRRHDLSLDDVLLYLGITAEEMSDILEEFGKQK